MDVGAGLCMYDVIVKKFTFAISSCDEFLSISSTRFQFFGFGIHRPPQCKSILVCENTKTVNILQWKVSVEVYRPTWRASDISPIFKKGSRKDPANYRPVSLTLVVCKVIESIIKDDMVTLLEDEGSLNPSQHGFMKKRSCLTKLLECFEEWTKALDEGYGIYVIYLDYRKAFHSVPHKRLIMKLNELWISQYYDHMD